MMVITAFPFFRPVIFPEADTAATVLSEDVNFSLSVLTTGTVFTLRIILVPFFILKDPEGVTVRVLVGTFDFITALR